MGHLFGTLFFMNAYIKAGKFSFFNEKNNL